MKKNLLALIVLAFTVTGFSQTLVEVNSQIVNDIMPSSSVLMKSATCGPDTVEYTLAKSTGFATININSATSAQAISQYYDAPQPITISGAEFYAYKIDLTGGVTIDVGLKIFAAGLDSMPTGVALASTIVSVDTSFGGGLLSVLRKEGSFIPVTMTVPYVVVIENISPNSIGLVFNDYNVADGASEWLAGVDLFGTYTRSYNVVVGGVPFDADLLIYPFVTYNLAADFAISNACMSTGPSITFTDNSSSILGNRMYNQTTYAGTPELSYTWDYGDGSMTENFVNPFHVYPNTLGPFNVLLTDTIFGWTSMCTTDTTITIGGGTITSLFSQSSTGLSASFTDLSTSSGTIATYLWDLGDGNTSTMQNPSHTYAMNGTYTVCLTVVNNCGVTDSTCQSITVNGCTAPVAGFTISGTDPDYTFTNTSTSTGSSTYLWDFGDGSNSVQMNPTHTYATNGNFVVVLTVSDSCDTNSFSLSIAVFSVGQDELSTIDISVYPNPTKDLLSINSPSVINRIQIIDLLGKVFYSSDVNDFATEINTSYLADGTYIVLVHTPNGVISKSRFVVLR